MMMVTTSTPISTQDPVVVVVAKRMHTLDLLRSVGIEVRQPAKHCRLGRRLGSEAQGRAIIERMCERWKQEAMGIGDEPEEFYDNFDETMTKEEMEKDIADVIEQMRQQSLAEQRRCEIDKKRKQYPDFNIAHESLPSFHVSSICAQSPENDRSMTPANINRTVVRNVDKFNRSDNIVDVNEVDKNETIDSHMHRSIRTPLRCNTTMILTAPTMSGTARRTGIPILKSRIVGTPVLHRPMRPLVVPDVEITLDLSTNSVIDNDAINVVRDAELVANVLDLSADSDTDHSIHLIRDTESVPSTQFVRQNAIDVNDSVFSIFSQDLSPSFTDECNQIVDNLAANQLVNSHHSASIRLSGISEFNSSADSVASHVVHVVCNAESVASPKMMLPKPKIVVNNTDNCTPNVRRSTRPRVPRLAHYLGQHIVYKNKQNGGMIINFESMLTDNRELVGISDVQITDPTFKKYRTTDGDKIIDYKKIQQRRRQNMCRLNEQYVQRMQKKARVAALRSRHRQGFDLSQSLSDIE